MNGPPSQTDPWTAQLAALLQRDLALPGTGAAVQALAVSLPAGNAAADLTRQTILRLLDQRRAQILPPPLMQTAPTPLPAWPGDPLQPVPGFHPAGLVGTSLVSACLDAAPDLSCLTSWLGTAVDEVVLILAAAPEIGRAHV